MTIGQVYNYFSLDAGLRLHQLRVATVIRVLYDLLAFYVSLQHDRTFLVKVGLVHDLGNMVKSLTMGSLTPTRTSADQETARRHLALYGTNASEATVAMLDEVGADKLLVEMVQQIGVDELSSLLLTSDWDRYICQYADLRVAPRGIVSLDERLQDFYIRYRQQIGSQRDAIEKRTHQLEQRILTAAAQTEILIAEPTELEMKRLLAIEL